MTRVLVCGGRAYRNHAMVWRTLDRLHEERRFTAMIQGGAAGADVIARDWARTKPSIERYVSRADWKAFGQAAGPMRNQRMLEWRPDLVVAFPTPGAVNRGTNDMIKRAREGGVEVIVVECSRFVPRETQGRSSSGKPLDVVARNIRRRPA